MSNAKINQCQSLFPYVLIEFRPKEPSSALEKNQIDILNLAKLPTIIFLSQTSLKIRFVKMSAFAIDFMPKIISAQQKLLLNAAAPKTIEYFKCSFNFYANQKWLDTCEDFTSQKVISSVFHVGMNFNLDKVDPVKCEFDECVLWSRTRKLLT